MKLKELKQAIDNLDKKQGDSVVTIVDLKTEDVMEKLLNKWDVLKSELSGDYKALENKVATSHSALENKVTTGQKELATSHSALKSELSSKLTTAYWVVGIAWATIATLLTIIALKP